LSSIIIPNSVIEIGQRCFERCSSLSAVTLSESLTVIPSEIFNYCTSLKSIVIPDGVKEIGSDAFYNCENLTTIIIGSKIETIFTYAFRKCPNLKDVYCFAEELPTTMSGIFQDSNPNYATLHVPASSIDKYKSTEPWSQFKDIVPLTNEDYALSIDEVIKETYEENIYTLSGYKLNKIQTGLNIIRMKNGKTKKLLVK